MSSDRLDKEGPHIHSSSNVGFLCPLSILAPLGFDQVCRPSERKSERDSFVCSEHSTPPSCPFFEPLVRVAITHA